MSKITLAVRETGFSWHNGGPIKDRPEYDNAVMVWGIC